MHGSVKYVSYFVMCIHYTMLILGEYSCVNASLISLSNTNLYYFIVVQIAISENALDDSSNKLFQNHHQKSVKSNIVLCDETINTATERDLNMHVQSDRVYIKPAELSDAIGVSVYEDSSVEIPVVNVFEASIVEVE